ncbi:MAG: DUF3800 domain-containing protein, partial [Conexivisphaera sp.]
HESAEGPRTRAFSAGPGGGKFTVFVGESGDLGFGPGSSKGFVVAFVASEDPDRLDARMKRLLKEINEYANRKAEWLSSNARVKPPDLRIRHVNSMEVGGLQAADFAAGVIRRFVEGDSRFYDLIRDKVRWDLCETW